MCDRDRVCVRVCMSVCELLHTVCVYAAVCVCISMCVCLLQYVGDPVSLAISEAVLTVVEEEGMAVHAEQLGAYIQSQLRAMANKHPCIADIRYNMYNNKHITSFTVWLRYIIHQSNENAFSVLQGLWVVYWR